MMKINFVINNKNEYSGLSCYGNNLYAQLYQLKKKEKLDVNLIETSKSFPKIFLFLNKVVPFNMKTIFSNNPIFLPKTKGLFHLTTQNFTIPLFFNKKIAKKSIVTIHDMILFEKNLPEGKASFLKRMLVRAQLKSLKRSKRIITDSEYSKKRIIKMINYPSDKIDVVYLGVDRKKYNITRGKREKFTILYVGSEMPRKNLKTLLQAIATVKKEIPSIKFVKVGESQWPNSRKNLKRLIAQLDLQDTVTFKNSVSDLRKEYNKATVFVHPSLYEGFGLPILEAMACGCPVISSDKTSLPEVAGDSSLYFDGYDSEDLAEKIISVLKNKKLQNQLRSKGLKRAKKFTWEKCAEKTIKVYKKI